MSKKYKNIIIVLSCLLVVSVGINIYNIIDIYPAPKASEALDWNSAYAYTLAYPDEGSGSIVVSMDDKYNPKQYIKLDKKYDHILMVDDGIIVSDKTGSVKYKNEDGKLVVDASAPVYDLGAFMTSALSIGDGLFVQKNVDASNVTAKQLQKDVKRDASITISYPVDYQQAFVVDGVNYIPHDFDSINLRQH